MERPRSRKNLRVLEEKVKSQLKNKDWQSLAIFFPCVMRCLAGNYMYISVPDKYV